MAFSSLSRYVAAAIAVMGVMTANTAVAHSSRPRGHRIDQRASCTFSTTSALASGKASCKEIVLSNMQVPKGETLDLTGLADGTKVTFSGTTTFGYDEWEGPLISADGSIHIQGASGSVIDMDGSRWWDGKGTNGGKTKPKAFAAHKMTDATITGITLKNTPVHAFSINNCQSVTLDKITMDNLDGDAGGGHNTDAFDVGSSSNITITNAKINNQDDCLAVNSGTDIYFNNNFCSGGHGISIGSVGGRDDNTVDGVHIEDCTVEKSMNGVRVKTVYGATGKVNDVHFKNVELSGITDYGIVIEQDYENGSPTGTPTTGVPITNLEVSGVKGTVEADATNIYILCGKGSCSNWTWSGNSVTGGKKSTKCSNIPSGGAAC